MVNGLDLFREHFKNYTDNYFLIGGSACDIAMEEFGESFRTTKDLDIVICIEALNNEFVKSFWDFIIKGGYKNQQKSTGKKLFYRFSKPENSEFPFMLELFSRLPDTLQHNSSKNLTPIPVEENVSSLSAIILDDEYYNFIQKGKLVDDFISYIAPEYIIPLKTRAWQDLSDRKNAGESISLRQIKKHKNDVFRIFRIVNPETKIELYESMKKNINIFLDRASEDKPDLKMLGYRSNNVDEIIKDMKIFYCL